MKSTKGLKRWILGLVILEAVLFAIEDLILGGDATTTPKSMFAGFVLLVNLPGVVLAFTLGLGPKGDRGRYPDLRPDITEMVVFGVGLMFYGLCLWRLTQRPGKNDNSDQSSHPKDSVD